MRWRRATTIVFGTAALTGIGSGCKSEPDLPPDARAPHTVVQGLPAAPKQPSGPPVPKEPAVLQTQIAMPEGGTCQATLDADCVACLRKEGRADLPEACDALKGKASEGPGAGVAKSELCREALDCMRRTSCHANAVVDCYCGKMTGGECTTSIEAKGACRKELDRALEMRPGALGGAALDLITELRVAGGVAGLTATAESTACASVCIPYKATSCR